MKVALISVLAAALIVAGGQAAAPRAFAAADIVSVTVPIGGTQSGGALSGIFHVTTFSISSAGELIATGIFDGVFSSPAGVTQLTVVASSLVSGTCPTLSLPALHIDLLGLIVPLSDVELAAPGKAGDLLCKIARFLATGHSSDRNVQRLVDELNQLLG